jgi:hypothetical protein
VRRRLRLHQPKGNPVHHTCDVEPRLPLGAGPQLELRGHDVAVPLGLLPVNDGDVTRALLRVQRHIEAVAKDLQESFGVRNVAEDVYNPQRLGLSEPMVESSQRLDEQWFDQRFPHPADAKLRHLLVLEPAPTDADEIGYDLLLDGSFGTDQVQRSMLT